MGRVRVLRPVELVVQRSTCYCVQLQSRAMIQHPLLRPVRREDGSAVLVAAAEQHAHAPVLKCTDPCE
jgi:hypothetical protein